ncbi:MAG: hypothetical protein GY786_01360 [Proteobacteria bacterium]|nr:hypothetical protein [Pseudomonadota bacterium]
MGKLAINDSLLISLYSQYLAIYEKDFSEDRFTAFSANIFKIAEHNKNPDKTYIQGINKFTDMTFEEFKSFYLMEP